MGFCSVCGSWVDEGDICSHCGNSDATMGKKNSLRRVGHCKADLKPFWIILLTRKTHN